MWYHIDNGHRVIFMRWWNTSVLQCWFQTDSRGHSIEARWRLKVKQWVKFKCFQSPPDASTLPPSCISRALKKLHVAHCDFSFLSLSLPSLSVSCSFHRHKHIVVSRESEDRRAVNITKDVWSNLLLLQSWDPSSLKDHSSALACVAQLVGVLSSTSKGSWFNSLSEHIPTFWVWPLLMANLGCAKFDLLKYKSDGLVSLLVVHGCTEAETFNPCYVLLGTCLGRAGNQ